MPGAEDGDPDYWANYALNKMAKGRQGLAAYDIDYDDDDDYM